MIWNFLWGLAIWGGWIFAAGLIAVAAVAILGLDNQEPWLCRYADRKDQQRLVAMVDRLELERQQEFRYLLHADDDPATLDLDYASRMRRLAWERETERRFRGSRV